MDMYCKKNEKEVETAHKIEQLNRNLLTFDKKNSSMRIFTFLFVVLSFSASAQKKKPFSGKFIYSIQAVDTALRTLLPDKQMVIYTNDTLLRIENDTDQFGKQIVIKHLHLNKSYLLLQTPSANYAIQTDHAAPSPRQVQAPKYSFQKKRFQRKTTRFGYSEKMLRVTHEKFKEELPFYYLPQFSVGYLNAFENFPGLLTNYYIATPDGLLSFTLIAMEEMVPSRNLFGIPSDYKKVTFDEFTKEMFGAEEKK
jgi:hypothetical protein